MLTAELVKKIRRIEIRTRRLVNDSFAGEYHSIFKGAGIEFNEVRPYIPGDEVRSIDWNVTARMGQLYVKRYVEERELTVMLVVDASGSGDFGSVRHFKRELAAELAAVLSFSATTNNDKVGLLIFTDKIELYIPPRKGRRHVLRLIRDLLVFKPGGRGTDIRLALETINKILKRKSIIFLISDFLLPPQSYRQSLFITNRKHDVIAIDLHDPLETSMGHAGILTLQDSESGELDWVDTRDKNWQNAFSQKVHQLEAEKMQALYRSNVDCIQISTDHEYVTALTRFFEQRARRIAR
jgi:uncharacterized protein (DUF58 family)